MPPRLCRRDVCLRSPRSFVRAKIDDLSGAYTNDRQVQRLPVLRPEKRVVDACQVVVLTTVITDLPRSTRCEVSLGPGIGSPQLCGAALPTIPRARDPSVPVRESARG